MNKRNYQKEMDQVLDQLCTDKEETAPTLLLHSCCAPCSSYVLGIPVQVFQDHSSLLQS